VHADTYVGIDVGGGGIRIAAIVHGRRRDARDRGPVPRSAGRIDAPTLAARIGALVARIHRDGRATRVAIGLTGMPGLLDSPPVLAGHLHRHIATRTVIIAGDSLTTHLGALRGRPGCVVAAGTGVMVLGTDHATTWNRADGWGYLLGDEGSGAWIGAHGVRAALRNYDGRDEGSEVLLRKLGERFGDPSAVLQVIYGSESPAHELAAFAPDVAKAAHEGDPIANRIWRRAGVHLADAAYAASRGISAEFSWGGHLFDVGALLLDAFRDELIQRIPHAHLSAPAGQAADGALLLAQRGLATDRSRHTPYAVEFAAERGTLP
jgi:N-acetylglucosamine kinase-like BadF-type ATPase